MFSFCELIEMFAISHLCIEQAVRATTENPFNPGASKDLKHTEFRGNVQAKTREDNVENSFHVCGKIVEKMLHYDLGFIQILRIKVVLSRLNQSCHGVTG